jgi:hypothetical protein
MELQWLPLLELRLSLEPGSLPWPLRLLLQQPLRLLVLVPPQLLVLPSERFVTRATAAACMP